MVDAKLTAPVCDAKVMAPVVNARVKEFPFARATNWLRVLCWASGILFLWTGMGFFLTEVLSNRPNPGAVPPSISDLATIFFGASSLALIIFSLILAIAAIIEWQSLKGEVARVIATAEATMERVRRATEENQARVSILEDSTKGRFNAIEKELRGRAAAMMGAMMGTLHVNPTAEKQEDGAEDYIAEAVLFCRNGYKSLKDLEGNGKYMALNNLVYFSSFLDLDSRRDELLAEGRVLRDVGRKYDDSPHIAPYYLTFCRVVLAYGTDVQEIQQALAIAKDIAARKPTRLLTQEATYLVASLTAKRDRLSGPAR